MLVVLADLCVNPVDMFTQGVSSTLISPLHVVFAYARWDLGGARDGVCRPDFFFSIKWDLGP